jgi:hypothetical protein
MRNSNLPRLSSLALFLLLAKPALCAPVGVFDDAVDIGPPPVAGSTVLNGSTYTLRGTGDDIWDGGDQLHFAYKLVGGDFTATVRITRRDRTPAGSGQWGRHGLMARWSLDRNSKYSFVGTLLPTQDNPAAWHPPLYQFRRIHLQNDTNRINYWVDDGTFPNAGRLPTWMRLVRRGTAVYGYLAEDANGDGQPDRWCFAGSDSSPYMPEQLLVGVALQPQAGTNLGTIAVDSVTIERPGRSPPLDCEPGSVFASSDYSSGFGALAPSVRIAVKSGAFTPAVTGGRLRLMQDGTFSASTAVWYDITGSETLTANGFLVEFDAFMVKPGLPGDVNPADGMTFAVVQAGSGLGDLTQLGGDGGGAIGYGGSRLRELAECHPSFAVEMDNWVGGGEPGNEPFDAGAPNFDGRYHFGLDVNAEVSSIQTNADLGVATDLLPDAFDPAGVHVRVRYSPDGQVDVFARSNRPFSAEYPVLSAALPPLAGPVIFGFTAGTGAATSTQEVDNLVVTSLSCAPPSGFTAAGYAIDLGNIAGGGDGARDLPAGFIGVDPRNGRFATAYVNGPVADSDPEGDGLNPSPGDGPYIDSVFFIGPQHFGDFLLPQAITQSGLRYEFAQADEANSGSNMILKDRNGGVSSPGITVGSLTGFTTAVGIHASMGVTFDLDALRARHGAENVGCFSTVWGMDGCAGGDVNLYAVLSGDSTGVIAARRFRATQSTSQVVTLVIPTSARYLTLATGANGAGTCDRGTFARAVITPLPCPGYGSFTWLWSAAPNVVSTAGGQDVTFAGEYLAPSDALRIGGADVTNLVYVNERTVRGRTPPLSPGFHDAEVVNVDGVVTARLHNAVEAVPPAAVTAIEPRDVFRDVATPVNVRGRDFRPQTRVAVVASAGGQLPFQNLVVVSDTLITASAPPLPAGEPNGLKSVSATDSRGTSTLAQAIQYVDPSGIRLDSVTPPLVSTFGGTEVTFTGAGFREGLLTPRVGGQPLSAVVFLDANRLRGTTPPLPAGIHTADLLRSTGGVAVTLPNAVEAAPPLVLTSVDPRDVYRDGTTPVSVRGRNFHALTRVQVGGRDLVNPALSPDGTLISGFAPALPAGEALGTRDVTAADPRGSALLPAAVRYVDPPPVSLQSVSPNVVSTLGGTEVTFTGANFRDGVHTPRLGGQPLGNVVIIDSAHLRGTSPALSAGFHAADVRNTVGAVVASLPSAVEAAPPVTLTGVTPRQVFRTGTTRVTVQGTSFRAVTRIRIGGRDLVDPALGAGGTAITGVAPALGPGELLGERVVVALDPRGNATLPAGVTYVEPPPPDLLPGPQGVETSLAYGTARFSWTNPLPYSAVDVETLDGSPIASLPAGSTHVELDAPGADRVDVRLVGRVGVEQAEPVVACALRHLCEWPAPLVYGGAPGKLELSLFGGNTAFTVSRCSAPAGGEGGGAGDAEGRGPEGAGAGGFTTFETIGHVVTNELLSTMERPNKLVTGFVLDRDADKLEIAAHYEKNATDFGLSLHGRLIHVFPEDGFEDDFTFPDALIKEGKKLNCITYFRADKDIGIPGVPGHSDPARRPPESCRLPIPAGEYLLELYAVGADPRVPYYTFSDDPRDNELLIRGAPCPPYPLVKVTDLTGFLTLPDITQISVQFRSCRSVGSLIVCPCEPGKLAVRFVAHGLWTDESGGAHAVPALNAADENPNFEYRWKIHDQPNPTVKSSGPNPRLDYCLPDWGCYRIEVEVLDLGCGLTKKRGLEVPVVPPPSDVTCPGDFTFLFPTPEPTDFFALVGLNPPNAPLGPGRFQGTLPLEFRVFVVPRCYCDDDDPTDCEAPETDDVEFRMAFRNGNALVPVEGVEFAVEDLCRNVPYGAKFFMVRVDDLGKLARLDGLEPMKFAHAFFQGRRKPPPGGDPNAGWRVVGEGNAKPINLGNPPLSLDETFWSGRFSPEDRSYHFVTKSSNSTERLLDIGPSRAVDLGIPGVDVGIPSYQNELASGFTSRFLMQNGHWAPEVGTGTSSGQVLSNRVEAAAAQVMPAVSMGGGAGGDNLPVYEWCDHREIFKQEISQTLFHSLIFAGSVGPIPVTIFGSIGLGLDVLVESYTRVYVAPFGPLEGGSFAETDFYLLSTVDVAIPCEISADILGGIISVAFRLIPAARFILDTHVWSRDAGGGGEVCASATMDLVMEIEGCLSLLITEICASVEIPLLEDEPLMDPIGGDLCRPPRTCSGGGAGAEAALPLAEGVGAGGAVITFPYQSISAPVTVFSPDRRTWMDLAFDQDGITEITMNNDPVARAFPAQSGHYLNPDAVFVSNSAALVAWTTSYFDEAGVLEPTTLAEENLLHAQQEIVVSPVVLMPPVRPGGLPFWEVLDPIRIADPASEVPDPAARRADGMASIARDLSALRDNPPGGEAIVAWVRYDGDYFVLDGRKTVLRRCPGTTAAALAQCPTNNFYEEEVDNYRPQMERTAIYARRVNLSGPIPGEGKVRLSPPGRGINIEPSVALAPSGNVGYCVWVHDPVHTDMIGSNRGRRLLYSVYSAAANSWSAPASVLPRLADYDERFPGALEPFLALKGDGANGLGEGLLAFTAVKAGSLEDDSGLGGSRFLYAARLQDGVFGEPFLIHGKCLRRVYGWTPKIYFDLPDLVDPRTMLGIRQPDWVTVFQGTGPVGIREGSGDVMVSVIGQGMSEWTAPVSLTQDEDIHSNVAAGLAGGTLRTISLNSGPASLSARAGAGGGAGLKRERRFEVIEARLEPDVAIAGCRLSDPFSAPGSFVTASVEVENFGLAASPVDQGGRSAVGLELVFVGGDGSESVMATALLPELQPAEKRQLPPITIEMPHDPVRLRVRLNPNPIDRDLTNNSRECFFGAPAPEDFHCERVQIDDEAKRLAVRLTWSNPAVYDELLLYRDGAQFASLPGACVSFVDLHPAGPGSRYEARGRIGASKSMRAAASCESTPRFRRGDANGDGNIDITDGIFTLGFLFLGGRAPGCPKAADANDSGVLDITDAIFVLNFLFLGGRAPPAPHPTCGEDETEDALACETQAACEN